MAIVALIGRPNVGKSSIFNRLIGERKAIEAFEAGTTRDRVSGTVITKSGSFTLMDMAGVIANNDLLDKLTNEQVKIGIEQADAILFVVDAQEGVTEEDKRIAEVIRQSKKPVVVAANKADNQRLEDSMYQFASFGFKELMPVSAIHNFGMSALSGSLSKLLPISKAERQKANQIKVAIIGRPNVGKSTLLNHYAGTTRSVVSEIAGTTRDSVDFEYDHKGREIIFVDTAGVRRNGKVEVGIEKFSVARTVKSVNDSDIAILLIDALEGATAMDSHIAGMAVEAGRGIILAVNKWDMVSAKWKVESGKMDAEEGVEDDRIQREFLGKLQTEFAFIPWAPVIFISGLDGLNDHKLIDLIVKIDEQRKHVLSNDELRSAVEYAQQNHPNLPLIYAIEQSAINPPTFSVLVNRPQTWHYSYIRFIENILRSINSYQGTPIDVSALPYLKSQR